jgi:rubrerythrin
MEINTAAALITYISKIEQESAKLYEKLAKKHEELRETFLSFAKENKQNETNIKRAYYSVISDALEACFSFGGLNADNSLSQPIVDEDTSLSEVLRYSIDLEEGIEMFYSKAAEQSKALLADLPRVIGHVAKLRNKRRMKLRVLLDKT